MDDPVSYDPWAGQTSPTIASDGSGYLVAWVNERSGRLELWGTRLAADHSILDPSGIPLATARDSCGFPAVASDGTGYLVTWSQYSGPTGALPRACSALWSMLLESCRRRWVCHLRRRMVGRSFGHRLERYRLPGRLVGRPVGHGHESVYAARVSPTGTVLDTNGVKVGSGSYPAVSSDGNDFVVSWIDGTTVQAARISSAGIVLDQPPIVLASGSGSAWTAVAWNGSDYLVVWSDTRNTDYDLYGARLTSAGAILDTGSFSITTSSGNQVIPQLASDGTDFLTWAGRSRRPATRICSSGLGRGCSSGRPGSGACEQHFA